MILYELITRNTVKIYSEFYELFFQIADERRLDGAAIDVAQV